MCSTKEEFKKLLESRDPNVIQVPAYVLQDDNRLGVGGNGEVYSWGKFVLKITHPKEAMKETEYLKRYTKQNVHFKMIEPYCGFTAVIVPTEKYWKTFEDVVFMEKCSREEILEMFGKAMVELERLHFLGVCHRDIHFGNIMFTHKNSYSGVSFIDFGLAKENDNIEGAACDVEDAIEMCCEALNHFDYHLNGVSEFLRNLYRETQEARASHRVLRSGKVVKKRRLN